VLVVAPQFPAANQPWIDTYLEQLLLNRFTVAICSLNHEVGPYAVKVDRLGLREKILPLSLAQRDVVRGALRGFFRAAASSFELVRAAQSVSGSLRDLVLNTVHALHFKEANLEDIEIIHSHDEGLAYRFLVLAAFRRIPLVLTFHGLPPSDVGQLDANKRKVLYRYVSKVFVNTEFAKRQVCALGCDPQKIAVLPQGLCLEEFPFPPRPSPGAKPLLHVLTVGRYHRDKGQAYALLALRRLLNEGLDIRWTFIGVGLDLPRLRRITSKLGLSDHVTFLVELPQDEVRPRYRECDLFVLPSIEGRGGWAETQGVVLQEAQASGCIPIATRTGGVPECVRDGVDGVLVRQKSAREIAQAIAFFYHHPGEWERFRAAGRQNVEQNYSADVIGARMSEQLRTALPQSADGAGAECSISRG